jgi:maltose alpha-D-glucosyltransferase/alpha-amylase
MAVGDTRPLVKALEATRERPATSQWVMFLRNHDELDQGRLRPAQRKRVFERFAPERHMRLYRRGIRSRLAPMLGNDRRLLELAYSLMFTLPGTPVLRYGDEIGMGDDLSLPERNCIRTAMQWSSEPHGGFTDARRSAVPVIDDGPFGYEQLNVAAQRRDPDSLLNWIERVIRMRKELPEVGWGECDVIELDNPALLVLLYRWRNNAVLFVHNVADEPCEACFALPEPDGRSDVLVNLLSEDHSHAGDDHRHRIAIEPYGYRWFRVGGLDYVMKRTEV